MLAVAMAGEAGPPGTEMTGISFRDQLWLNTFPLERGLVFDYFAISPFYDRTCNNEQLRMRSIHPLDTSHLSFLVYFYSNLPVIEVHSLHKGKMTGVEYMLHEVQEPHLFVLRKQKRDAQEKVTPICAYYILDGSIYQAPNLHNVIGSRLVRAVYYISKAFSEAATKLEKVGYDNESDTKMESKSDTDETKKEVDVFDVKEMRRVDQLLAAIQRKLPPAPPPPPFMPVVTPDSGTSILNDGAITQAPQQEQQGGGDASALGKSTARGAVSEPPVKRVKPERL